MKKILTGFLFLFPIISLCQKAEILKKITGTWMNIDYYNYLINIQDSEYRKTTPPRILYIDNKGGCYLENSFEHAYNKGLPLVKTDNWGKITLHYFQNYGFSLQSGKDSLLEMSYDDKSKSKEYFRKISNYYLCKTCGIQFFFKDFFWKKIDEWKMLKISDKDTITQSVIIKYGKIFDEKKINLITEYEFADDYTVVLNNEKLFTIVFLKTINNLMNDQRMFAVKKEDNKITLYNEGKIEYIFIQMP